MPVLMNRSWIPSLLVAISLSSPALAQSADSRAQGLAKDAMEEDYLATNMKAALAKLQTALRVCGKDCEGTLLPAGPVLVAGQLPARA